MKKLFTLLLLIGAIYLPQLVSASHIAGADFTYKCLGAGSGNTIRYQVRLDLYQDCQNGQPGAIQEDNPAYFRIFDGNGNPVIFDSLFNPSVLIVPTNFNNICVNNVPSTCLRRATFIGTYDLPANGSGYIVAYQRCCRNAATNNIVNPGSVGATYTCIIPPTTSPTNCNNSAIFKNFPPQIICINNPLIYDHGATDTDGDSLSYEFCEALTGGSPNDAKPFPQPPPYTPVNYTQNFSAQQPMAGFPLVQIDHATGIITGTPNIGGRFVVTVCCHEWRNGQIINTVKREFQFVVTNCSKAVVANIPQYSSDFNTYLVECSSYTVHFVNQSNGGIDYFWDFGVPGVTNDTSRDFEPSFTYPDTGTYVVKLVLNRGSTCPDSITRLVKIYPQFRTDFVKVGKLCPDIPVQFFDSTSSTFPTVNAWSWSFGDGGNSTDKNPVHTFTNGGTYNVRLISQNTRGCVDTITKPIMVDDFNPFAGNDTIIVKGEYINFNATGGDVYSWTPSTYLDNTTIPNPTGYYPVVDSILYIVHIASEAGCFGDDSIKVTVVNDAALFVPSGFSPNGDGLNDVLKPIGIGYRNINNFRVFNRFGEMVFYTTKFDEGWDGTWKGRRADLGVYYWLLQVTDRFGNKQTVKGDATLIR